MCEANQKQWFKYMWHLYINVMMSSYNCDQILEKTPSTHTTARHTFHHQMIAVYIDLQLRQVWMLKVTYAAFAVACF